MSSPTPGGDLPPPLPLDQLRSGHQLLVRNATRGVQLAGRLRLALDSLSRLRGLLWTAPLEPGEGLLLRPCAGIHTFFMSYPIDALFLDPDGAVVARRCGLRPYRLTPIFGRAAATLELQAGAVEASGTAQGDVLVFHPVT